ncbi:MAG TPA: alpha-amylase [Planctomycetota bacterium]|nr:alpha-amylase [Planctomycetota bacterium]
MVNGVMLQAFQWYLPSGVLWTSLAADAAQLAAAGFTALWIPPPGKGAGGANDVGYAVYDRYDLGEFNQKGGIATKYGTQVQLVAAISRLQQVGIAVYADVVFNHMDGGDATEVVMAQRVSWDDRNQAVSDWYPIRMWTSFTFPGRAGVYSAMRWSAECFDAVSYDDFYSELGNSQLFRLKDKTFSTDVSHEHGNYDYLIACDLDLGVPAVRADLFAWGRWLLDTTRVDGFRLDACKHMRASFFPDWLGDLRARSGRALFTVGEYWSGDTGELHDYLAATGGCLSLFDVPLHYRFHAAGRAGSSYDLRTILDGTLMREQPALAVTFVDNHDSQPCQSLESWVEPWFKPLAYALILLRREGYPCVFAGDYGATVGYQDKGREVTLWSHRFLIDIFLDARRRYGFGDQHDYFDHPNTIGWLRTGDATHPGAMAVLLTNSAPGRKWMNTFRPGAVFADATGHIAGTVQADQAGWAEFTCPGGSVSVWLQR